MEDLFDSVPADLNSVNSGMVPEDLLKIMSKKAVSAALRAEVASGPHPEVNEQLTDGPGVYGYYDANARWGREQTVAALIEIGEIWYARFDNRCYGVGDISLRGGGDIAGHASHELGVDADIRLIRGDWEESHTTWQSGNYSRLHTQQLINLFWSNCNAPVELIFFNDPQARGVRYWDNHDNHLHVRFYPVATTSGPPHLARGNSNVAANRELQYTLNAWHHLNSLPGNLLVVDGAFGGNTEIRLRDFQEADGGLEANGSADSATWSALGQWRREPFQETFLA